jgi:rod shape-determining protein MreD
MINSILRFGLIFVLLMLLQVLLFNNIQFSGYINPYIYILFILLLPVDIPAWILLLLAFAAGSVIDFFSGSPGMHSAATVLAAFTRPYILRVISPRDGYEANPEPSMITYGFRWFLTYSLLVVLIHHTALFYLEVFRLTEFFRTMFRVILSSLFSITFVLLIEFYRKGR